MPKKLIILISGKKQSGKNTLAHQIVADLLNAHLPYATAYVNDEGDLFIEERQRGCYLGESPKLTTKLDIGPGGRDAACGWCGHELVRIMSFADPIKDFCMKVMGLRHEQVYGSDSQKNTATHLLWDNLPAYLRWKHAQRTWWNPLSWLAFREGPMTAREVMQVFGTDLIRSWHPDAWAKALIQRAIEASEPLVIVPDMRFPNELAAGCDADEDDDDDVMVRAVRLQRNVSNDSHLSETALDGTPLHRFDLVIPPDATVSSQHSVAHPRVMNWFAEAGLLPLKKAA